MDICKALCLAALVLFLSEGVNGRHILGEVRDPVLKGVLDQHNSMRAKHGAAALTWSTSLQDGAQRWADNCVFEHDNSGHGENLAMGYAAFKDGVQAWYDEVSQYNYNNPGFSSATGHFTQTVWKGTKELGCAWNQGCKLYVCRYNPPGNVLGQFPQNVA